MVGVAGIKLDACSTVGLRQKDALAEKLCFRDFFSTSPAKENRRQPGNSACYISRDGERRANKPFDRYWINWIRATTNSSLLLVGPLPFARLRCALVGLEPATASNRLKF